MSETPSVRLPGVLWHVTVTLHGQPLASGRLAQALGKMALAHGLGLSARFLPDTVELRYWDEGHDCRLVAEHGLNLWDVHREAAGLPSWPVVGLEVLDRTSFRRRWPPGSIEDDLFTPGVKPMPR
jgi:hypothetical protein